MWPALRPPGWSAPRCSLRDPAGPLFMIIKLSAKAKPSIEEALLRSPREVLGLPDLRLWRDYYFELKSAPSDDALERLRLALEDSNSETVTLGECRSPRNA